MCTVENDTRVHSCVSPDDHWDKFKELKYQVKGKQQNMSNWVIFYGKTSVLMLFVLSPRARCHLVQLCPDE